MPVFSQEIQSIEKVAIDNAFNSKYIGQIEDKHFVINYNVNVFRNVIKDINEDKLDPKTVINLLIFDSEGALISKKQLEYEYKFQQLLFAGILDQKISLIYSSRKGKGTVLENFNLDGSKANFSILSEEKKKNYILSSEFNKFLVHITTEHCYIYDHQVKNLDKFNFQTDSIIDIINYKDGFLLTHRNEDEYEIIEFSPTSGIKKHQHEVSKTWVCKSPKISIDSKNSDQFYLTYLIGKTINKTGGWDFSDTRFDHQFRSKGLEIVYFNGVDNLVKDRSILFESNIIYGTNPNANNEQNMGCTNLHNHGVINFDNQLLIVFEEQRMKRKESVNPLTDTKTVTHNFIFHDLIFVKLGNMTSIQNFLIKACETNMDESQLGTYHLVLEENKAVILYNQTYIQEKKHKLLSAILDFSIELSDKQLHKTFNDQPLNLVLNTDRNYGKSKYFLALQAGFVDLTILKN